MLVVMVASEAAREGTPLNVEKRFDVRFEVTYRRGNQYLLHRYDKQWSKGYVQSNRSPYAEGEVVWLESDLHLEP